LRHYSNGHSLDVVVVVGGTNFVPRDVMLEAGTAAIRRPALGTDEAMRRASTETSPFAVLFGEVPVVRNGTQILGLPGSERDAVERLLAFLPALGRRIAPGEPAA